MILYFLLFLLASVLCFTLPGIYLLQKSKIVFSFFEKLILGTIIGFVSFTLISYMLGILGAPFLVLPLVTLFGLISLKTIFKSKINLNLRSIQQLLIFMAIFILGVIGQMAIIAPSGMKANQDLVFFSANGHDGPWHIALMEEVKKGYPLQNPIFAGEKLVNYHFFSDIAPSAFSYFFKFSNLDLYFRFFPFLNSILLGAMAFLLGCRLGGSLNAGAWSAFFVYFTGSFGYFVTWMKNHTIGGESIFWATQIQSSIGNPPQIISNILVLTFLYFFIILLSKKNWVLFVVSVIILGSLIEFKVYASVVVLISLFVVGIIQLLKVRGFYILSLFGLSSLLSAALYLPNTIASASFLIYEPWWFIRTMIVVDSRLNWLDLELRRQTYISEGNWKRVVQLETTGFLIFFFGNLGTRFLGLIYVIGSRKNIFKNLNLLLMLLISLVSLILPLLFLQKGVASNTIQFLQYFLLIFGIFAALALTDLQKRMKNKFFKTLFIILVIISSIPTQVGLLYDFYHKAPLAKITTQELQALTYLKENLGNDSVIMTPPYNKYLNLNISTPPIWGWFDTSYVSAFSSKRTYLSDIEQVDIMGYSYKKREGFQKLVFEDNNTEKIVQMLKDENINYIYYPKQLRPTNNLSTLLPKVFENEQIEILRVD